VPSRDEVLARIRHARPCTNDAAVKLTEVLDAIDVLVPKRVLAQIRELLNRGAFRHYEDVAYAAIMLERGLESVDQIALHLADYAIGHRCDPV
jgi:hypothetical protein